MSRVDQWVPGFAAYDAIGSHVLRIRDALRQAGFDSDVYGEHIDPRVASEARHFREAPAEGAILYHSSTSTDMVPELIARIARGQTVISDYHNITPPEYFDRWQPDAAASMRRARAQLAELAPHVPFSVADSAFNAAELLDAGYAAAEVCPILVDTDAFHEPPAAKALDRLRRRRDAGGPEWLFVGRLAPNKCQHDVIAAFAAYRRVFEPGAHLTLVGSTVSARYLRALHQLVDELGCRGAVDFAEGVGHGELLAHFAVADAFVCLSEHEGFCVPVVEAMELGVPVVALARAALPETVAGAGLLLDDADPLTVACAVDAVVADAGQRDELVAAGRRRAADFALPVTRARMLEAVGGAL